jgi:oligoendopeptidase F
MTEHTFEQTRWSLADLLPAVEGPEFEQYLADLEAAVGELEASRETLSPEISDESFLRLLGLVETIASLSQRLGYYGGLWFAADTQDQDALAYRGRMEKLLTGARNRMLFFELWWKGLDDEAAERMLAASGDNAYYLESLRRFKPHTLTEPEEKVINLKDVNGVEALVTIYDMITSDFTYKLEVDGEVKELTRDALAVYVRDPRPEVRAAAYQELYRVFGEQSTVLAQIYQHVARDWASENLSLRSFSSPISVRNLRNDIPDPVADTLLEACRQNASLFQRWFRLKAGWLGMEKLRRYDIYAPLSSADKTYPFGEAADMVLDTLDGFSPALAGHARQVFAP